MVIDLWSSLLNLEHSIELDEKGAWLVHDKMFPLFRKMIAEGGKVNEKRGGRTLLLELLNPKTTSRWDEFMQAVYAEKGMLLTFRRKAVQTLLELGANVNGRGSSGRTALMLTIKNNDDLLIVLDLLKTGANPLEGTNNGLDLLAYLNSHSEISDYEYLIEPIEPIIKNIMSCNDIKDYPITSKKSLKV